MDLLNAASEHDDYLIYAQVVLGQVSEGAGGEFIDSDSDDDGPRGDSKADLRRAPGETSRGMGGDDTKSKTHKGEPPA